MKYTLTSKDEFSGTTTTHEFTHDFLHEILSEIELFLRGAGFYFDGNLEFVGGTLDTNIEPELDSGASYTGQDYDEYQYGLVPKTKSHHYFDNERNK